MLSEVGLNLLEGVRELGPLLAFVMPGGSPSTTLPMPGQPFRWTTPLRLLRLHPAVRTAFLLKDLYDLLTVPGADSPEGWTRSSVDCDPCAEWNYCGDIKIVPRRNGLDCAQVPWDNVGDTEAAFCTSTNVSRIQRQNSGSAFAREIETWTRPANPAICFDPSQLEPQTKPRLLPDARRMRPPYDPSRVPDYLRPPTQPKQEPTKTPNWERPTPTAFEPDPRFFPQPRTRPRIEPGDPTRAPRNDPRVRPVPGPGPRGRPRTRTQPPTFYPTPNPTTLPDPVPRPDSEVRPLPQFEYPEIDTGTDTAPEPLPDPLPHPFTPTPADQDVDELDRPRRRDRRHPERRPRRGEKERKFRLSTKLGPFEKFFSEITEGLDTLDCLHKALPKDKQAPTKFYRDSQGNNPKAARVSAKRKAKAVYDNFEHIDFNKYLDCEIQNQIEDRVIAGNARRASRAFGRATGRGVGIGVGPTL